MKAEPSACPGWLGGDLDFSLCSPFPMPCSSVVQGTPIPVCTLSFLEHLTPFLQTLIKWPRTVLVYQGMTGHATKRRDDRTTGQGAQVCVWAWLKKLEGFPSSPLLTPRGYLRTLYPALSPSCPTPEGCRGWGRSMWSLVPRWWEQQQGQDWCWHRGGAHPACTGLAWPRGNASGRRSNGEGFSGEETKCTERAFTKREAPRGCPVSIPGWQPSPKLMRTHQVCGPPTRRCTLYKVFLIFH